MPLFQYFGLVGSLLLAVLFAADWCYSAPISPAPHSDVPLDQKIKIPIRIINGLTAWCSTRRVRRWSMKRQATPRLTLVETKRQPGLSGNLSTRSPRSDVVFENLAPMAKSPTATPVANASQMELARARR
jgi:hypothetical protein